MSLYNYVGLSGPLSLTKYCFDKKCSSGTILIKFVFIIQNNICIHNNFKLKISETLSCWMKRIQQQQGVHEIYIFVFILNYLERYYDN